MTFLAQTVTELRFAISGFVLIHFDIRARASEAAEKNGEEPKRFSFSRLFSLTNVEKQLTVPHRHFHNWPMCPLFGLSPYHFFLSYVWQTYKKLISMFPFPLILFSIRVILKKTPQRDSIFLFLWNKEAFQYMCLSFSCQKMEESIAWIKCHWFYLSGYPASAPNLREKNGACRRSKQTYGRAGHVQTDTLGKIS